MREKTKMSVLANFIKYEFVGILVCAALVFGGTCSRALAGGFISAPSRTDMVYDAARSVLYITSGNKVLRYNIATGSFLTPYTFNLANLSGIDLSPDGNTLAIADRNLTGIHLVDLETDTIKPDIMFTPASSEGGSFTVAYGNDGALLVSTQFNGSGWVPLRRVEPQTGAVTVISKSSFPSDVRQDTMLSASADGNCIGYAESNSSDGPFGVYDTASRSITVNLQSTTGTGWFNYEISANRDCTQFAVPTYGGTFIYDKNLAKLGTIGTYAGEQPIGAVYSPVSDIVYFAWAGKGEVRAYDTKTFSLIASFDTGYTFQNSGNYAFNQGRLKVSRDGSLLFATVGGGVWYRKTALNPEADDQSLFIKTAAPTAITLTGNSPKGLPLTYTVLTQPSHGTLKGTAPNITYTPATEYSGPDSFTFKASDGVLDSAAATVTVTVDKAPPVIESFSIPAISSTLTVPVTDLSVTDNIGVTGYCLSESADPAACTWTATPPATYRFGGVGTHTLYALARDAAGNISEPSSDTVNIPEIVPVITSFRIPATYSYTNPTVSVTLVATDDIGVTGYCLSESADPSACTWNGWAPTSYSFTTVGPHTLYAFARNSTGKVSAPASASTTAVGQMNFIPAADRKDMIYDVARDIVYITSGTSVLRYKLASNTFLAPYQFGLGNLYGIDISPDGNTLAVADSNITGIHLVDLSTGSIKPDITFAPSLNGEGGTFSVAFGKDGALLVSSRYNGSGFAPLRRIVPGTGEVKIIKSMISQDAMISGSADGKCIGFVEGNSSNGPLSVYDVASQQITNTVSTDWFTYEVGANRDCTQFAVPTYGGTFIYDNSLTKLGAVGTYAGEQPIGIAYNPLADIVYFAWAGTSEVRAYDTTAFTQARAFDFGYTFQNTGNHAFGQGRLKVSRDGSLLFATIQGGVRYQRLSSAAPVADNQKISAYGGMPLPVTLTGGSPKNLPLTFSVITRPGHGSLQGTAPNLIYTPNTGYAGIDTITFQADDGSLQSNVATIMIELQPDVTNTVVNAPTIKGQLTITWTNPLDPDFSHVHIYRSTTQGVRGGLIADNVTAGSYTDQGLNSLTTYYYTVHAVDNSGYESTNTAQVSQATLDATPPITTPSVLGGTFTSSQNVALVCNDGTGGGCAATYYCLGAGCSPTSPYTGGIIAIVSSTDLRFFSVDKAGNSEQVKSASFSIQPRYLTVNPQSLNFGQALLYYGSSLTVTIGNGGSMPLSVSTPLTITGPDSALFSVAPGGSSPCTSLTPAIAAGGSCTVSVRLNPDSTGIKQAYLHIVSNADNAPIRDVPAYGMVVPAIYLTSKITGKGVINNIDSPPNFSCDTPSCAAPFAAGVTLTLHATPSSLYDFAGWLGGGCGGTGDCILTLTTDTTVTAAFTPLPLVRIDGGNVSYPSISAALADATGNVTIKCRDVTFTEDVVLDRLLDITILGGYGDNFDRAGACSILSGNLTIGRGSLTVDNLVIN